MPHHRAGGVGGAGEVRGVAGVDLLGAHPLAKPFRRLAPARGEGRVLLPLDAPLRIVRALTVAHQEYSHGITYPHLPRGHPPPDTGGGDSP
jgi:hypothetical protein